MSAAVAQLAVRLAAAAASSTGLVAAACMAGPAAAAEPLWPGAQFRDQHLRLVRRDPGHGIRAAAIMAATITTDTTTAIRRSSGSGTAIRTIRATDMMTTTKTPT